MPKQRVETDQAPRPGGAYSQGLRAGDFVFVSGQVPIDPATGDVVGDTIEGQTAQTLDNVKAILEAAGAGMDDVVRATVHLRDLSLFAGFNDVYARYFPDPKPTRTTVGSQVGDVMVEIDVIAYVGDR
jgi:2-iminobutanoate/2-iminopropanoate deaminase